MRTSELHAGATTQLQLLLENSKLKKGHNYVKKMLSITFPTGRGSLLTSQSFK